MNRRTSLRSGEDLRPLEYQLTLGTRSWRSNISLEPAARRGNFGRSLNDSGAKERRDRRITAYCSRGEASISGEAFLNVLVFNFKYLWPGTESNRRRRPFQGRALPTELPGQMVGKRARSIGTYAKKLSTSQELRIPKLCKVFVGLVTKKSLTDSSGVYNSRRCGWR